MNKKKVIVSLFVTIIAVLLTTTSMSVAWYVSNDILRIDDFDLEISGGEDLFIGTKIDEEFTKRQLTYSDLIETTSFRPVSTMKSSSWLLEEKQNPTFYDNYRIAGTQLIKDDASGVNYALPTDNIARDGFYSQELFLYSKSSYYAVIDSLDTWIISDKEKNAENAKEIKEYYKQMADMYTLQSKDVPEEYLKSENEILDELNKIHLSARISLLITHGDSYKYCIIDPNKGINETVYYGGLLDTDVNGEYDYYLDSTTQDKYEILYGDIKDRSKIVYGSKTAVFTPAEGKVSWKNSGHAENVYPIDLENSTDLVINKEPSLSLNENDEYLSKIYSKTLTNEEKEKLVLIPVDGMHATRIVLSIYFEGWDLDNINETMNASFKAKIKFKTLDRHIV